MKLMSPFVERFVGPVPFSITDPQKASAWLVSECKTVSEGPARTVRLANAYCVALTESNVPYRQLLSSEGVNFPDGLPVVWAMRFLGRTGDAQRVRGPSFFERVLDDGREHGVRHFFLGSTRETLDLLIEECARRYPSVEIAGSLAPPFGELTEEFYSDAMAAIDGANADIVWVGMGTPKQDFAATELARRSGLFCVGVGAAFDFVAGTTREAPAWVQSSGLEWLFRLVSEPRRLWRRYFFGNATFLMIAARSGIRSLS